MFRGPPGYHPQVARGPRAQPPLRPLRTRRPPEILFVVTFHVHDLAPVKELVDLVHRPRRGRRRRVETKRTRQSPVAPAGPDRAEEPHPPVFLVDDEHLLFIAPSRKAAAFVRRMAENNLGTAVAYVDTRAVPRPTGPARRKGNNGSRRNCGRGNGASRPSSSCFGPMGTFT